METENSNDIQTKQVRIPSDVVEFEGKTYTRDSNAMFWKVLDYLRAKPDAHAMSVRKLEAETGVGKTLAGKAKDYYLQNEHGNYIQ